MSLVRRRLAAISYPGACLFAAAMYLAVVGVVVADPIDDAFINFRYLEQLLDGHGLVFNPGERLEGFSSPLWLLLLVPGAWLSRVFDSPELLPQWAQALGTLAMLANWALLAFVAPRQLRLSRWAVLFVATVMLWSPFSFAWARAGLETPLVALLAGSALLLDCPTPLPATGYRTPGGSMPRWARPLAAASLAVLCWVRPEGPLLATVVLLAASPWPTRAARGEWMRRHAWPLARRFLACVALPTALLLALRWSYFGTWLPHAYDAKMSSGAAHWWRGARYVGEFFIASGGPFALLFAAIAALGRLRAVVARLLLVVLTLALVVVLEGGDPLWHSRFMVPVLPLWVLLVALGIDAVGTVERASRRWVALTLLLPWGAAMMGDLLTRQLVRDAYNVELKHQQVDAAARGFRAVLLDDETVATRTAGRFVYRTQPRAAYDHLGTVLPNIVAAAPGVSVRTPDHWRVMLARKPTFVVWRLTPTPELPCTLTGARGEPRGLPGSFALLDGDRDYLVVFVRARSGRLLFPFLMRRDVLAQRRARSVPIFTALGACFAD
jgi:hypothetical protein